MKRLLVFLLFTASVAVMADDYSVDADLAKPISQGGLQIQTIADITALNSWRGDRARHILVPTVDGWVDLVGGGSTNVAQGSYAVEGGPMGGDRYARLYDGVSDVDTTVFVPSVAISDTLFFEIIYRTTTVGVPISYGDYFININQPGHYRFQLTNSNTEIFTIDSAGNRVDITGPDTQDGKYHVTRSVVYPDSFRLWVDDTDVGAETPVSGVFPDSTYNYILGAARSNRTTYQVLLDGSIAYVGIYQGTPDSTANYALYNLLADHLDGTAAFAAIQPAVHLREAGATDDTITVSKSCFPEPVKIDSVLTLRCTSGRAYITRGDLAASYTLLDTTGSGATVTNVFTSEFCPYDGARIYPWNTPAWGTKRDKWGVR